jgi:CarD family transcriptional regulator
MMFSKGDYVVYGSNGPCLVTDVTRLSIHGCDNKRKYYVLKPVISEKSTIYSPVDNQKVIIRGVLTKEEAKKVLAEIDDIEMTEVRSEKYREEQYKEIIRNSNVREYIGMLKALASKRKARESNGRKFTTVDERYLREVEEILCSEFAIALGEERILAF